jgi:hypothetical protein
MGGEVFALTDEQILEMEPEVASGAPGTDEELLEIGASGAERGGDGKTESGGGNSGEREITHSADSVRNDGLAAPPKWLAERMRDPRHGDEAKELWEGALLARQEAEAYRDAVGTPAEARALKEIYPGGVNEAKTAAERARQLEEFDAAYFGAAGRPAEELSAARVQLAQRLLEQDPAAFREMVAAGMRLLEARGNSAANGAARQDLGSKPGSLDSGLQKAQTSARDDSRSPNMEGRPVNTAQTGMSVPPEVAERYVAFEKAANAELEKSVGGAIARALENALPNLKSLDRAGRDAAGQGTPLPERLGAAVREEVEAALKSDAQLGEQVARILGARRFDDAVRAQVVRVIDARAQQLVPGAVRRVVGSWTTATLGARGKSRAEEAGVASKSESVERVAPRTGKSEQNAGKKENAEKRAAGRMGNRGRVDYGKLSDEQILDMS